jgi:hypothetical protein
MVAGSHAAETDKAESVHDYASVTLLLIIFPDAGAPAVFPLAKNYALALKNNCYKLYHKRPVKAIPRFAVYKLRETGLYVKNCVRILLRHTGARHKKSAHAKGKPRMSALCMIFSCFRA